jgi:mutual gliding-motility protein MglA
MQRRWKRNLAAQGYSIEKVPLVIQYNKRDQPEVASVAELNSLLNPRNRRVFEAVARTGVGVMDTLKAVAMLVLAEQRKGGP